MLKRRRIDLPEAQAVLASFQRIPIRLYEPDLDRALELAARLNVYAYDAYVISCALTTASPLLSLDGGQREAARKAGVTVIDLNT